MLGRGLPCSASAHGDPAAEVGVCTTSTALQYACWVCDTGVVRHLRRRYKRQPAWVVPALGAQKTGFDFVFPGLPMALPGGAACGLWHYHFTVVLCASYRCSLGVFGARYRLRPHHVGIFGRSCVLVAQCRGAPFVEPGPRVFGYVAVLAEVEDGFLFGHAVDSAVFPESVPGALGTVFEYVASFSYEHVLCVLSCIQYTFHRVE